MGGSMPTRYQAKTQYGYAYVDPSHNTIKYDNEPYPYRDKERTEDRVKKYREEQDKRLRSLRRSLFWKFTQAAMFLMASISLAITALLYWEI